MNQQLIKQCFNSMNYLNNATSQLHLSCKFQRGAVSMNAERTHSINNVNIKSGIKNATPQTTWQLSLHWNKINHMVNITFEFNMRLRIEGPSPAVHYAYLKPIKPGTNQTGKYAMNKTLIKPNTWSIHTRSNQAKQPTQSKLLQTTNYSNVFWLNQNLVNHRHSSPYLIRPNLIKRNTTRIILDKPKPCQANRNQTKPSQLNPMQTKQII